jgi:hypothetical protein
MAVRTAKSKHRLKKKPKSNETPLRPAAENLSLFPNPITAEERAERRNNWLAPAGSLQERRSLEKWASQQGLGEKDRALVYSWLAKPDGFAERNALFWHAAKRQILGPVFYDMAIERHKRLRPDEWLVACLITEGLNQKEEIAPMIGKSLRTVEYLVVNIKEEIVQDLGCNIEAVTIAQIARWFLGL